LLTTIKPSYAVQDYGVLQVNLNTAGTPLSMGQNAMPMALALMPIQLLISHYLKMPKHCLSSQG
jgi:hypothetical protein